MKCFKEMFPLARMFALAVIHSEYPLKDIHRYKLKLTLIQQK